MTNSKGHFWSNKPSTLKRRLSQGTRFKPALEQLEDRCLMTADIVLRWNEIALTAGVIDHTPAGANLSGLSDQPGSGALAHGGPTRAARALAIVHAAIYDAVNSVDQTHTPYLVLKNGPPGASLQAAAARAAHDTLVALYPLQTTSFDVALQQSLADIPDGPAENKGLAIGMFVANKILLARKNDGAQVNPTYVPGTQPGDHREDPLNPGQGFLTPGWGNVKPFALTSSVQFPVAAPPALDSVAYATAFNEVKDYGGDGMTTPTMRTPTQTEIGLFWACDGSPGLGVPPRLYNQIARTIAVQEANTEVENARLFALVNLAMADAGIAAWQVKYQYNFWRPVLGIREADLGTGPSGLGDGNPSTTGDVNWTPLGAPSTNSNAPNFTPPFPAYASGHATFGAALFQTLTNFYGTNDIAFTFTSDELNGINKDDATGAPRPLSPRSFTSFSQASEENGQSRIYLGIHWSFDKTEGIAQGNAIADWVFQNYLRPAPAPLTVAGGNGGQGPAAQTQTPSSFFLDAATVSARKAGPGTDSSSHSGPFVVPAPKGAPLSAISPAQLPSRGRVGSAGLSLGTEAKGKVCALDAVFGSAQFLNGLGNPFA